MKLIITCLWVFVILIFCDANSVPSEGAGEPCQPDKLTVYKVILHTFWTSDKFPKHYPLWRPNAQWTKVFGRSHDKSFVLFRLGQKSSAGVKQFAELGKTDLLEKQTQGEGGIYDEFNAPPIPQGSGKTEAEFFVDGNHSRVSLMSRIVPSPDWFIGIDSFDLCVNGNWLDSITIEVDPIDAGTDNGFTFTAPDWPTDPQGVSYRITSLIPAHPASSFYYPNLKRLPPIGTFQFIKVKEYELSEVFHHAEDDERYELLKTENRLNSINIMNGNNGNNDIEEAIEEEREEQEVHIKRKMRPQFEQFLNQPMPTMQTPSTQQWTTVNKFMTAISPKRDDILSTPMTQQAGLMPILPRGDKDAILNSIVNSYRQNPHKGHHHKKYRSEKPRKNPHKIRPPRPCKVGAWSEWSACSKTCDIGEMQRERKILKHPRRGGQKCPPLVETKWCGTGQSCAKYFNRW